MKAKTKADGPVTYVQLCHNAWDPKRRASRAKVLYNFGRADQLDLDALRRLVRSISRFLPPDEVEQMQETLGVEWPIEFLGARSLGGSWLLDRLWRRLQIGKTLARLGRKRAFDIPIERLIFAMVANRALAPSSKLNMEHWLANNVFIPDLPEVEVHQLYRAMDFLLEASEEIQHGVFTAVADLFNLEVDVLFLDTTTTYFEIDEEDEAVDDESPTRAGFRRRGHSKDHRPEQAQVVIAFAVTRSGIPVRCWVWPGNTSDQSIVEEVKRDLNDWRLGRVLLVEDAGFNSEENRRTLQGAGGHYIIGEKLRPGRGQPHEALRRGGAYRTLENGLEAKEVILGGESEARRRFAVVRNPEEAQRDRKRRQSIVEEIERRLDELQQLEGKPHEKKACELRSHRRFGRYIRQTKTGKLRLDKAKIKADEQFDGKHLISTSDDGISLEDFVAGYRQLWEIERVFRDVKHLIDIRPVYHRLEERIRAHVLLCWLGMLLIRVAETETKQTWHQMKKSLASLQVGIHSCRSGEIWQTNPVKAEVKELFAALELELPPRYLALPAPKAKTA